MRLSSLSTPMKLRMLFVVSLMVSIFMVTGYRARLIYLGNRYVIMNDRGNLNQLISGRPELATSLLETAFKQSNRQAFLQLLDAGANPSKSWIHSEWGTEALLHKTAELEDSFWLEQALIHGADPNQRDNPNSVNPLMYAIQSRLPKNAVLIVKFGADVNATSQVGETMLSFAMSQGEFETIHFLLEKGANVNPSGLIARSFIYLMQYHLQGTQGEVTFATTKDTGTLQHLDAILAWFDQQRLDWRNASYDESTGNIPKTWNIPLLPDPKPNDSLP